MTAAWAAGLLAGAGVGGRRGGGLVAVVPWPARPGGSAYLRVPAAAVLARLAAIAGDPAGLGLAAAGHPLLGAAVELPGTGGVVLTGRLSLATQPWLADHRVGGIVLLPGAAFAELVVRAGDEAGCGLVEELVLQVPLVLPVRGGVQVRVSVGGPSDDGRRVVEVHSRGDDAGAGGRWTCHAAGALAAGPAPLPSFDLAARPPPGAERADAAGIYDVLAGRGLGYGPAFRGLVGGLAARTGSVR